MLDRGLGVMSHVFVPDERGSFSFPAHGLAHMDGDLAAAGLRWHSTSSAEMTRRSHIEYGACGSLSEVFGSKALRDGIIGFSLAFSSFGVQDFLFFRGLSPDGSGAVVLAPSRRLERPDESFRETWSRYASHLSAGFWLRRLLDGLVDADATVDGADLLSTYGNSFHRDCFAGASTACDLLRTAALTADQNRQNARARAPEDFELWQGLVAGEWSLVDSFAKGGRRFVIAKKNAPKVIDPRALTVREREVAAYAALGLSNKVISFHLDLSKSTVASHLRNVLEKLNLKSRLEFVEFFQGHRVAASIADDEDK